MVVEMSDTTVQGDGTCANVCMQLMILMRIRVDYPRSNLGYVASIFLGVMSSFDGADAGSEAGASLVGVFGVTEDSDACSFVSSDVWELASISGSFFSSAFSTSKSLLFEEGCECAASSSTSFPCSSLCLRRRIDRQTAKLTKKLTKSTIIPKLQIIAMAIPTTTRGMGSTPIGSLINGMRAAVVAILTIERNRARVSEPLVWPGRKMMSAPNINSSTTTSPTT